MNSEPWGTAIDVARHLGVVKDTVYRWHERKGLLAHKIGRLWKFQQRFFDFVSPLENKKQKLLRENDEIEASRDGLLPLLMNGQVTVA